MSTSSGRRSSSSPRTGARGAASAKPKETVTQRTARETAAHHATAASWQAAHPEAQPESVPLFTGYSYRTFQDAILPVDDYASRTEGLPFVNVSVDPGSRDLIMYDRAMYGDDQLGAWLYGYTPETLKESAVSMGLSTSGKFDQLVSRIVSAATSGHYSANFTKALADAQAREKARQATAREARAARAAARAASGKPSRAPKQTVAPIRDLVPVTANANLEYGRDGELNAYGLQQLYGNAQLRDALEGYTLATLKDFAQTVMERNPGTAPRNRTTKAAVTDYIVEQLTRRG